MFLISGVLAYFFVLFKIIAYSAGYLSDIALVAICTIIAWGLLSPQESPQVYLNQYLASDGLPIKLPIVIVIYGFTSYIVYELFYSKVTTYSRWLYATRTLFLIVFSIILLPIATFLMANGNLVQTLGEAFGLFLFALTFILLTWTAFGFAYVFTDSFSRDDDISTSVPQSLMTPQKTISIMVKRRTEFTKAYIKPKQLHMRLRP